MNARDDTNLPAIADKAELLAYAYAIEVDALERYQMLAEQMEVHNNSKVAALFRELAGHEEKHAAEILEQAGDTSLPELSATDFKWLGQESPESAELEDAHYKMTPWHALQMALRAEKRAFAFFDHVVASTEDEELKAWAREFRDEEAEHVELVERLLAKTPEPAPGWDDDDDPPYLQD